MCHREWSSTPKFPKSLSGLSHEGRISHKCLARLEKICQRSLGSKTAWGLVGGRMHQSHVFYSFWCKDTSMVCATWNPVLPDLLHASSMPWKTPNSLFCERNRMPDVNSCAGTRLSCLGWLSPDRGGGWSLGGYYRIALFSKQSSHSCRCGWC